MIEEFLQEDSSEAYYILTDGKKSTKETTLACAKTKLSDSAEIFFVKFHRGKLFDPYGVDKNKIANARYRKVDATTFDLYLSYLKSRRGALLLRAERRCIDV